MNFKYVVSFTYKTPNGMNNPMTLTFDAETEQSDVQLLDLVNGQIAGHGVTKLDTVTKWIRSDQVGKVILPNPNAPKPPAAGQSATQVPAKTEVVLPKTNAPTPPAPPAPVVPVVPKVA